MREENMSGILRYLRALSFIALAWVIFSSGIGCSSSVDSPSASARLAEDLDQIRLSQGEGWGLIVPGMSAALLSANQSGEVIAAAMGTADPPEAVPLTRADRFHMGSITKTFTAALILQLVQEGRLELSDPISSWISYPGGESITIEMVLGHTSGVPNFNELPGFSPDLTPLQSIALAAKQPLQFPSGSDWAYSNTNYTILGVIAESLTGMPWSTLLDERFFEPLSLTDTYVFTGEPQAPTIIGSRLDCGFPNEPECVKRPGFSLIPVTNGFDWVVAWSAGAIVSTPSDMAKWIKALTTGAVLNTAHTQLMMTASPQSRRVLSEQPTYGTMRWTGCGLGLLEYEFEGHGTGWGHEGAITGFVANAVHMNVSGKTFAFAVNFQQVNGFEVLGQLVSSNTGK